MRLHIRLSLIGTKLRLSTKVGLLRSVLLGRHMCKLLRVLVKDRVSRSVKSLSTILPVGVLFLLVVHIRSDGMFSADTSHATLLCRGVLVQVLRAKGVGLL